MRELVRTMETVAEDDDMENSPTIPVSSVVKTRDQVNCSIGNLFMENGDVVHVDATPIPKKSRLTSVEDATTKPRESFASKPENPEVGQYSLEFLHEVGNRMAKGAVPRNRSASCDDEKEYNEGACSLNEQEAYYKDAFSHIEHQSYPRVLYPYSLSGYAPYQRPYGPQIKPHPHSLLQREKVLPFNQNVAFDNFYKRRYYLPRFDNYKVGIYNRQPHFASYGYDGELQNDIYFDQNGYRTVNANYCIKESVEPCMQNGLSGHRFYSQEESDSSYSTETKQKELSCCSSSEKLASGNSSLTLSTESDALRKDNEDNSSIGSFNTDITMHSDNVYQRRRYLEQDHKFDQRSPLHQPPLDTSKIFTTTYRSRSANSSINRWVETPPPHWQNKRGLLNFRRGFNFYSSQQMGRFGRYIPTTPADKHLTRMNLVEVKAPPVDMLTGSMWDSLSQEIWEKFIKHQQTEETFRKKMYLWRDLYIFIKSNYPSVGLYMVGSTISGFGADSSDVDMCLVSRVMNDVDPKSEAIFNLTTIMQLLSTLDRFNNFDLIKAKVPILRFSDLVGIIDVDLNYNNCVGVKNTHLLYCYSRCDWRVRPLSLVVKLWARAHNINNAKNRTISSYSLTLMVIHFLQCGVQPKIVPCLHTLYPEKFKIMTSQYDLGYINTIEHFGTFPTKNKQPLGELLLQFLEYYSNFDFQRFAISVRTGSVIPIGDCQRVQSAQNDPGQWQYLCIEEPFNLTNTALSVYDGETFDHIRNVFLKSWQILSRKRSLDSIFSIKLILEESPDVQMSEE